MRVTVSTVERRRRTPAEITELARKQVTGRALITDDPDVLDSAFFMVLAFMTFEPDVIPLIGAFIGYYDNAVSGMGMNGYPIFTGIDFVHTDDLPNLVAEIRRMKEALSPPTEGN